MHKSLHSIFFAVLIATICYNAATAQTVTSLVKTDSLKKDTVKKVRAQNLFVEFLGPGIALSANYDTRFSKKRTGLGVRVGVGYTSDNTTRIFSAPFQLNYLLGKSNHLFELGLGATYVKLKDLEYHDEQYYQAIPERYQRKIFTFPLDTKVIGTMTFGYRYQPATSGFSFRGMISPLFNDKNFVMFGGISVGYTLK
jgi:hypothetical protein